MIEDEDAYQAAQLHVSSNKPEQFRNNLGFIIKLNAEIQKSPDPKNKDSEENYYNLPLEIGCRLPSTYPLIEAPNIMVRCSTHNLTRKFTEDLSSFMSDSHSSESSILEIIEWIKENVKNYLNKSGQNSQKCQATKVINTQLNFSRMWIYSSHIYSLNKRKSIVQWAKDFDLNGFSKPGKPGMICVEGEQNNVQNFWTQLRSVPWQKLQIKDTESYLINDISKFNDLRKFTDFEEMTFSNENDSHIDIGLLFAFLKQKGFQNIFNIFFGVDGKLPDSPPK